MNQLHKNIRRNTAYVRTTMADNDLKLLWDAINNGMTVVRICETFEISTTLFYRFREEARAKYGDTTQAASNIDRLVISKTRLRQLMKYHNGGKSKKWILQFYDLASMEEVDRALVAGEEWQETQKPQELPKSKIDRSAFTVYSNKNYAQQYE